MKRPYITIAMLAATGLATAAAVSTRGNDERDVIRQIRAQQNDAIARRDFQAVAKSWSQDVTVRAGLGRNIQGSVAYLAAFVGDSSMTYTREPNEVVVSKNWPLAYERGRWVGRRRGLDQQPFLSGEYGAQWVKRGTDWLIRSEVFVALDCAPVACERLTVVP
jgi:ketosteroid isomerase-like protein